MLNKLMTALVANNSEKDDNKSSKMVNIKFNFRHLGVNANAHNYAFAEDCYS